MVIGVTLFVVAALVIAIWVLIEMKRMQHKVFAIVLIGLIIFSYVSAAVLFKDQGIDFKSTSGLMQAGKIYFSWLGTIFGNFKQITSNVIKMDWKSENKTSRSRRSRR
jgi:hypothetical protein